MSNYYIILQGGLYAEKAMCTRFSRPISSSSSCLDLLMIFHFGRFSPWLIHHFSGFSGNLPLWLFNIAMENGPFIDDFPIKTSIYKGFSMAMLNNQRVPGFLWLQGWEARATCRMRACTTPWRADSLCVAGWRSRSGFFFGISSFHPSWSLNIWVCLKMVYIPNEIAIFHRDNDQQNH